MIGAAALAPLNGPWLRVLPVKYSRPVPVTCELLLKSTPAIAPIPLSVSRPWLTKELPTMTLPDRRRSALLVNPPVTEIEQSLRITARELAVNEPLIVIVPVLCTDPLGRKSPLTTTEAWFSSNEPLST